MTLTIPTTNITGAGTAYATAADGDSLHVLEGILLLSTGPINEAISINHSNATIRIDGTVVSNFFTINGSSGLAGTSVAVGASGRLVSYEASSGNANVVFRSAATLTNLGEISSLSTGGILAVGGGLELYNAGTISGVNGLQLGVGTGVTLASSIVNAGTIIASGPFDDTQDFFETRGVSIFQSNVRIDNLAGGSIISNVAGGTGILAALSNVNNVRVVNAGDITAGSGIGVDFAAMLAGSISSLRNTGIITGETVAYLGSQGQDVVFNSGTFVGAVQLGEGNDTLIGIGGRVDGSINAGAGVDVIDLRGSSVTTGEVYGGTDFDRIWGGSADDGLYGGDDNDWVFGGKGDDWLDGGTGNDSIRGGEGNDTMSGGTGSDTIRGDAGDDQIFAEVGAVMLFGGDGDDQISVNVDAVSNMAEARGGAGNDTFQGGLLRDDIFGGDGDDVVFTSDGANVVDGGAGNDRIEGGANSDTLSGGADHDDIRGFGDADSLRGNSGDDTIFGFQGNDTISGGTGDDSLEGGTENDSLAGNSGRDTIQGGVGNDSIDGGDDDDVLVGGGQSDTIAGGRGDDIVNGDFGTDLLAGGAGRDTFVFGLAGHSGPAAAADTVTDFQRGQDILDVSLLAGPALVFRGLNAFSGGGTGSLRFDVAGGNATVRIDADGNGVAESEIILLGITTLTAADFAL